MVGAGTSQDMVGVLTSANVHLSVQTKRRGGATRKWLRKPGQAFASKKRKESLDKGQTYKKYFLGKQKKEGYFSLQTFDDKEFSKDR